MENLAMTDVKSIIYEDACKAQDDDISEPKMTRAKMRQHLAKGDGEMPYPWCLLPSSSMKTKKRFTDMEFPESDGEDEDFKPDSQPPVFNSPQLTAQDSEQESSDSCDELDLSDTVATRTRSQLPLTDTSISGLEAGFLPPDIFPGIDEPCALEDDPDWMNFLQSLVSNVKIGDDDDPTADPEYEIPSETESDHETAEVLQMDNDDGVEDGARNNQINDSEVDSLITELYESEWLTVDDDENNQEEQTSSKPLLPSNH